MSELNWTIAVAAKDKATSVLNNISNAVESLTANLTGMQGLGGILAGAGILAPFAVATKVAYDFEKVMGEVRSVTFATNEEMAKLSEIARTAGVSLGFAGSEAGKAMYYLGSAGFDANQTMASLNGTLLLARATNADLAFTTETVVTALGQYSMKAEEATRVADVYAAGIANSQLTIERLSDAMSYVGPVAAALNVSLEDTVTALGLLSRQGFYASKAGTALRMAMARLMNPVEGVATVLKELSLTASDVNLKTHSLVEVLRTLQGAGMDTSQAMTLFGIEAAPAMMALLNQTDDWEELAAKIRTTGMASEMAEMQMNTVAGQLAQTKALLADVAVQIGTYLLPVVSNALKLFRILIELFDKLPDPIKQAITYIGTLAGTFLIVRSVAEKLGFSIKFLNAKIIFIPAIAIAAGLGLGILGTAMLRTAQTGEDFATSLGNSYDFIKGKISGLMDKIYELIGLGHGEEGIETITEELTNFQSTMEEVGGTIEEMEQKYKDLAMYTALFGDTVDDTNKKLLAGETIYKGPLESMEAFKKRLHEAGVEMEYLEQQNIKNSITLDNIASQSAAFGEQYLEIVNQILEANGKETITFEQLQAQIEEYNASLEKTQKTILDLIDVKKFLGDTVDETREKLWNQDKVMMGKNETMEQFKERLMAAGVAEQVAAAAAEQGWIQLSTQEEMVAAFGQTYNQVMSQIGGNVVSLTNTLNGANSAMNTLLAYGTQVPIAYNMLPGFNVPSVPTPPPAMPMPYPEGYKSGAGGQPVNINIQITGSRQDAQEIERVFKTKIEPRMRRTIQQEVRGL